MDLFVTSMWAIQWDHFLFSISDNFYRTRNEYAVAIR